MEFSRQEYWSWLPCPSPGDLPNLEVKPGLPHCWQILYHLSYPGSPFIVFFFKYKLVLPYINMNPPQVYTCSHPESPSFLPPCTIPLGRPSAPAPNIQYHASNLDWRFISYMILYMFQCHSPKSSHPFPLPQSPKECSIHLCHFCYLTYRVIVTIFLNSIYMHYSERHGNTRPPNMPLEKPICRSGSNS